MADLQELLRAIPITDIANQLGIEPDVAEAAVKQALPTLVGGMAANARDEKGAASLTRAISAHKEGPAAPASVAEVDTSDGEKIVRNVFGSNKDQVVTAVATSSSSNVTQDIIAKVLPIIAPIVLAWLAKRFLGGPEKGTAEPAAKQESGGVGDLLGGLLGGGSGGDLGGLLGGLLGGGRR